MTADAALDLTLLEQRALLDAGTLSPVALTEAALARIGREDPVLHAFVTVTAERARADARRAAEELKRGRARSVVHGIPYGLKDNIDTAGIRTTWGATPFAARVPDRDATVAARLADAGAVLVGKLALIELAGSLGCTSAHASLTGACRNPWDTTRWTGGSSAGPAAAVAAGLVTFALGTETRSSLVYPAAFCGVTALRPTYGATSREGVLPFAYSVDKVGPLARSARDCAAVLQVLCGPDPADAATIPAPPGLGEIDPRAARGLRAAVFELPLRPVAPPPGMPLLYADALRALEGAGVRLVPCPLPAVPWREVFDLIVQAEAEVGFEDVVRSGRVHELADPSHRGRTSSYFRAGRPADYVKASVLRAQMQDAMRGFFRDADLIVGVTVASIAAPADEPLPPFSGNYLTVIGNLLGLPAASVPMGLVMPERLPAGLTILGPPLADARVLAAAALFQGVTDWHRARPPAAAARAAAG